MSDHHDLARRRFLHFFAASGLSSTLLPGTLWARLQDEEKPQRVTPQMLEQAAKLAGLDFTPEEREMMLKGVNEALESLEAIRAVPVDNSVPPALNFDPLAGRELGPAVRRPPVVGPVPPATVGDNLESLAFLHVTQLGQLVRTRQVTSRQLTEMYLERLERHDARLYCVVTLTRELALEQAERADREIAAGRYRGPLHGIPWGAKDLLAVRGYRTTWGAMPYMNQVIGQDATVVQRLEEAGAVLVAKLTLGALAWGDVWFGGKTRNPWNLEQGSSGSSAGSASAVGAGLVGFAIGSETWGSIVSPCTRCGVTGLRPTFGRVSRHGAMALSWSMDKLGPICRGVEDCALVLDAIQGPDGRDGSVRPAPWGWDGQKTAQGVRLGYVKAAFEDEPESEEGKKVRELDRRALERMRELGFELAEVALPEAPRVSPLSLILNAEAAAAFDELTRSNRDDELVRQIENAWPNVFRQSRLIPAVEYVQANRIRTMLMRELDSALADVDVYLAPSFGNSNLLLTNLTGHPCVVLPHGFVQDNRPASITFTGRLYEEEKLLLAARAYQQATDHHLKTPQTFAVA